MTFGAEKTHREPTIVTSSFEFLGIELCNGLIRPAAKAQIRFLGSLEANFAESKRSLLAGKKGERIKGERSLLATLRRANGIIQGWGKHYRFCNDFAALEKLDIRVTGMIRAYVGVHSAAAASMDDKGRRNALGVDLLSEIKLRPLKWPKRGASAAVNLPIITQAQVPHGQLS